MSSGGETGQQKNGGGPHRLSKMFDARQAFADPQPDHPRAAAVRKASGPVEAQAERTDVSCRYARRLDHLRLLLIRRPAQKGQGHMEVLRPDAAEPRKRLGKKV